MAPGQVQRIFRQHLSEICSQFDAFSRPVMVVGTIGEVPADHWRRREPTPLLDQRTGTVLLLELPPSLLAEDGLYAGESVRVWGVLRARLQQGQVMPRFEVFSISRDGEQARLRQADGLREILSHASPQRRDFPVKPKARMLLLGVGVERGRLASFQRLFGGFWQEADMALRVLTSGEDDLLMSSLIGVEEDILFLVLGEGVLTGQDSSVLMQGLLRCPAYRVLSCEAGGEGLVSVSDMAGLMIAYMVERFFESPAEAADHIRQETVIIRQKQDEEQARQEELSALRGSLTALTIQPGKKSHSLSIVPLLLAGMILGGILCLAGWWVGHILQGI